MSAENLGHSQILASYDKAQGRVRFLMVPSPDAHLVTIIRWDPDYETHGWWAETPIHLTPVHPGQVFYNELPSHQTERHVIYEAFFERARGRTWMRENHLRFVVELA